MPIAARHIGATRAELAALVALRFGAPDESPRLTPLRGVAAYAALSAAAQRFERSDALWRRELDAFSAIAGGAPIYELVRPRTCSADATASLL
jgi:hypothetical protein